MLMGMGAVALIIGSTLFALTLVNLLQRFSGLELWICYGDRWRSYFRNRLDHLIHGEAARREDESGSDREHSKSQRGCTMDNAQREIRNEIEATRAGMVEKIATLEDRVDCTIHGVKRSFDPHYQVEQHPWMAMGLAVAAGYLLSGLILGRPTPKAELVLPRRLG